MENEKTLLEILQDYLVKNLEISRQDAMKKSAELESSALKIADSKNPAIENRFKLLEEFEPEDIAQEIGSFMLDLTKNNYTQEQQLQKINDFFGEIGFNIAHNGENYEIKLIEPVSL